MSRLSRKTLPIPAGVTVSFATDGSVTTKGPLGELTLPGSVDIKVEQNEEGVVVKRLRDTKHARSLEGTYVRRILNLMHGVASGFEYILDLVGVGYRAQVQGEKLQLQLGFSHPIVKQMPKGVNVTTPTQTEIVFKGVDKVVVGQIASEIRALCPPEPYKGKGVRYRGEVVVMKEAKKK